MIKRRAVSRAAMAPRRGKPLTAADFWRASRGFSVVWLVHLGRRHGLLRVLAESKRPLAPSGIASRARRDAQTVRLWCEAAAALGLLKTARRRFALPPPLVPLLIDEESASYLGGHLDYLALRSLDFDAFDELFRDGRRSARPQRHLVEAFAKATRWDHTAFLEILIPKADPLRRALSRGADVLDVGAGTGAWDFRVARAFPRSRFVGLEPDRTALRLARAESARQGLEDRVQFEPGAAESMRFDERFDMVFLGEVLCSAKDARRILPRCRAALRPGGFLVVAEGLVDEAAAPRDPGNALILAMRLEFALQPAQFFTKREFLAELRRAGFSRPRLVGAGGGFYFAVARR